MLKTITAPLVTAALAGAAIAGVVYVNRDSKQPVAQTQQSSAPTPSVSQSAEPSVPAYVPPAVGEVVAAGDIETARAAGVNVYVSPRGDGTGLVVDPAAPIAPVAFEDLWATSQAMLTDEQIASIAWGDDSAVLDEDLRQAVREAVMAANYRLFVVDALLSFNDPNTNGVTHRVGWGGGFVLHTPAESRTVNDQFHDALVEGVPAGKQRSAFNDAITASPEAYVAASQKFLESNPAQVVILRK